MMRRLRALLTGNSEDNRTVYNVFLKHINGLLSSSCSRRKVSVYDEEYNLVMGRIAVDKG